MASPQPTASPTRSRGFSFGGKSEKSHKSQRSSGSGIKIDLTETPEEKARRSLKSKADPMIAINEAQPNLVAFEKSNLGSLRAIQHKDRYGNIITDPDLSNPTRHRFERPLDTIRSFEAAIYGPYTEESTPDADYSRRSSYSAAPNGYSDRGYNDQGGHYNGRPSYSRPDSYYDNGNGNGNPYYNNGGGASSESYYPYNQNGGRARRKQPRAYTDQPTYTNNNGYTQNGYYKSADNASGSGSGSSPDQWGNSTDPSSVDSSMDQIQQQNQEKAVADNYGFQGFGPGPKFSDPAIAGGAVGKASKAPAPVHDPTMGGPVGGIQAATTPALPNSGDNNANRKSWFKRTFSKK